MMEVPRRAKVLVVDDEPDLLSILERVLSYMGFAVFTAESGASALGVLAAEKDIDVLVTDVVMPVMDGLELTRTVFRLEWPHKPSVILITGDMRHLAEGESLFQGCPILRKPFDVMELVRLIQGLTQAPSH